jgi:hypothetical protein
VLAMADSAQQQSRNEQANAARTIRTLTASRVSDSCRMELTPQGGARVEGSQRTTYCQSERVPGRMQAGSSLGTGTCSQIGLRIQAAAAESKLRCRS